MSRKLGTFLRTLEAIYVNFLMVLLSFVLNFSQNTIMNDIKFLLHICFQTLRQSRKDHHPSFDHLWERVMRNLRMPNLRKSWKGIRTTSCRCFCKSLTRLWTMTRLMPLSHGRNLSLINSSSTTQNPFAKISYPSISNVRTYHRSFDSLICTISISWIENKRVKCTIIHFFERTRKICCTR